MFWYDYYAILLFLQRILRQFLKGRFGGVDGKNHIEGIILIYISDVISC